MVWIEEKGAAITPTLFNDCRPPASDSLDKGSENFNPSAEGRPTLLLNYNMTRAGMDTNTVNKRLKVRKASMGTAGTQKKLYKIWQLKLL